MAAKHWCFTLNNWTEEQLEEILNLDLEYLVVGKEVGENGTPHLQGYFALKKKGRVLKLLKKSKPHYEIMRGTPEQASAYCKKDGDFIERGEVPLNQVAKSHLAIEERRKRIREDPVKAYEDNLLNPGELGKAIADRELYLNILQRDKPTCSSFIPNIWGRLMPILQAKKRHYWVWSDSPDMGKTTWLNSIKDKFRADFYEYAESFQSLHSDIQFLMLDEFSTAHIKATTINRMCDGTYKYPRKNSTPVVLPNIILLVCGNKNPEEVYPNAFQFIEARFNIIQLLD